MFKDVLIQLRLENKMTQAELANKIGVVKGTIANYESGLRKPDNDKLIALSEVFGVSVDYLLGLEEIYNIQNKTRLIHSFGVTNFASQLNSSLIIAYNGKNILKQEIVKSIEHVLNNVEDEQKLSQIKMFLDTYVKK